jgi:uncharacterized protein (TIGR03663 family)
MGKMLDGVPADAAPATAAPDLSRLGAPVSSPTPRLAAPSLKPLFGAPAFYIALVAFAVLSRFLYLAAKPLHHDESLFAYYGYFLYRGWGYDYQPILHGPVLQFVSALFFLLFGDNNLTMRLPSAVGGLCILPVVWYWGRYLGRTGVRAALLLVVLSPSILYYSRFLRNDVPYLVVTMWCALALLRALDTGARRHVFWALFAAALAFCMMESSIFFFAACIGFLVVMTAIDWLRWRHVPADGIRQPPGNVLLFVPRARGENPLRAEVVFGCLLASVLLVIAVMFVYLRVFQFSLPVDMRIAGAIGPSNPQQSLLAARVIMVAALFPLALAFCLVTALNFQRPCGERGVYHYFLRVAWMNRWAVLGGIAVAVLMYAALFTTLFTHVEGVDFEGKKSALTPFQIYKNTFDYWWDQHKQHRIKGPFHFYLPILFLYELPAVLIVLAGWARSLFSGRRRLAHLAAFIGVQVAVLAAYLVATRVFGMKPDWGLLDRKIHITGPGHILLIVFYVQMLVHAAGAFFVRGAFVESFLTFWTVTSLFAYSYAGEKVPWLTVHTAGPLCLLAGLYVNRLAAAANWTRARRAAAWVAVALAVSWQFRQVAWLNFVHPWSPAERLVYNHTSPDIDLAVDQIKRIAHDTGYGPSLPILIKGEMEWPLYWYLRDYPNAFPGTADNAAATSRPVVLVDWEWSDVPNLKDNYVIQRMKVREWWEPPLLDAGKMLNVFRLLTPAESRRPGTENRQIADSAVLEWRKLWHYLAYRHIFLDLRDPVFSNNANEFAFCIRKDLFPTYLRREWLSQMPKRPDIPVFSEAPVINLTQDFESR